MKAGKIVTGVVVTGLVIGGAVVVINLISGAISILGGVFDTLLGVLVIAALIAIVAWMLHYAKK